MADETPQNQAPAPATEGAAPAATSMLADLADEETPEPQPAATIRKRRVFPGPEPLLFAKYSIADVTVADPGLVRYINLDPVAIPHTEARHGNRRFAKHHMNIVERLINHMMRTETWTGKKASAYRAVRGAFELIEQRTKQNPVQILVDAVEKAAPREEVTRLRYGGISVPKAVDVAPARRLDVALRHIAQGAVQSSHKSKTPISECIANEIVKASKADMNSFAVAKKEEVERVAKSAR